MSLHVAARARPRLTAGRRNGPPFSRVVPRRLTCSGLGAVLNWRVRRARQRYRPGASFEREWRGSHRSGALARDPGRVKPRTVPIIRFTLRVEPPRVPRAWPPPASPIRLPLFPWTWRSGVAVLLPSHLDRTAPHHSHAVPSGNPASTIIPNGKKKDPTAW